MSNPFEPPADPTKPGSMPGQPPYSGGQPGPEPQWGAPAQPYRGQIYNQYGQPGFQPSMAPRYTPPIRKTSTRGPSIMTYLGIFALVAATVLTVLGIGKIVSIVQTSFDPQSDSSVVIARTSEGTTEFEASAGTEYAIVTINSSNYTYGFLNFTVTDPAGEEVRVHINSNTAELTVSDETLSRYATFTAAESGMYTLTVEGSGARSIAILDASVFDDLVRDFIVGVFMTITGVFLGLVGLVLTITGGIMWGTRRKNARLQAMNPNQPTSASYPGQVPPFIT